MRNLPVQLFNSVTTALNQSSSPLDASFMIYGSAQAVVTGSGSAGTLRVQMSNDRPAAANLVQDTPPTNWTNISGLSVAVSGANTYLIPKFDISYQWLRLTYTSTGTGVQTVVVSADVAGSLNSKYFLLNSSILANLYYVWLDNGSGVDPAIPGRTGIQVVYSNGDSATTIGGAMATAIQAVNSGADFTAVNTSGSVAITMVVAGQFVAAVDGNTGFTFSTNMGVLSTQFKSIGA